MSCNKGCPHHVRHGKLAKDGKTVEFKDRCGLTMDKEVMCSHVPFDLRFNYRECDQYMVAFKSSVERNDVVPTKDINYSSRLSKSSFSDMDLL